MSVEELRQQFHTLFDKLKSGNEKEHFEGKLNESVVRQSRSILASKKCSSKIVNDDNIQRCSTPRFLSNDRRRCDRMNDEGNIRKSNLISTTEDAPQKFIIDIQDEDTLGHDEGKKQRHNLSESRTAATTHSPRGDPLLGYDWVAGLLDNQDESKIVNDGLKSETFFDDIRRFRRLYKSECIDETLPEYVLPASFTPIACTAVPSIRGSKHDDHDDEKHECVHLYRLNSRLFPEPIMKTLGGRSKCSICRRPRLKGESADKPSSIRISVPVYEETSKVVRFGDSESAKYSVPDSLSIGRHCVSGWQSAPQPALIIPPPGNIDLKSAAMLGTCLK